MPVWEEFDWSDYDIEASGFQDVFVDPFSPQWQDLGFVGSGLDSDTILDSIGGMDSIEGMLDFFGTGGGPDNWSNIGGALQGIFGGLGVDDDNLGALVGGQYNQLIQGVYDQTSFQIMNAIEGEIQSALLNIADDEGNIGDINIYDLQQEDLYNYLQEQLSGEDLANFNSEMESSMGYLQDAITGIMSQTALQIDTTLAEDVTSNWEGYVDPNLNPEIIETYYGGAYSEYDPRDALLAFDETQKEFNKLTDTFDRWAKSEQSKVWTEGMSASLKTQESTKQLTRNLESANLQHDMDKTALISSTISEVENINNQIGQTGLASTANTNKDIALDTVQSKINAANASQSLIRKQTKNEIENLEARRGESHSIRQITYDNQYDTQVGSLNTQFALLDNQLNQTIDSIYENWMSSQYGMVSDIFQYSPGGTGCGMGYYWDPVTQSCQTE